MRANAYLDYAPAVATALGSKDAHELQNKANSLPVCSWTPKFIGRGVKT